MRRSRQRPGPSTPTSDPGALPSPTPSKRWLCSEHSAGSWAVQGSDGGGSDPPDSHHTVLVSGTEGNGDPMETDLSLKAHTLLVSPGKHAPATRVGNATRRSRGVIHLAGTTATGTE